LSRSLYAKSRCSKGRYSNSLYVRTAVDKYNNWQPFPTFPSFAGVKEGGGEDDDPAATYQLVRQACFLTHLADAGASQSFQYTVYAYQEGIMFTIGQHDNEKNQSVATLNSKKLSIVASCNPRNDSLAAEEDTSSSSAADSSAKGSDSAASSSARRTHLPLDVYLSIAACIIAALVMFV
jgi:hypothetical protein